MAKAISIPTINVRTAIEKAAEWVRWACDVIISVGLALMIAVLVLSKFNLIRLGFLPQVNETWLAWTAGAWWLYKGGRLR